VVKSATKPEGYSSTASGRTFQTRTNDKIFLDPTIAYYC